MSSDTPAATHAERAGRCLDRRRRRLRVIALFTLGLIGVVLGLIVIRRHKEGPSEGSIGRRVAGNLTLRSVEGQLVTLSDFAEKKAVVLVFLGTQCPVGNLYSRRLADLDRTFGPRGVAILGINSNASETAEQVAEHACEYGLTFSVFKDDGNHAADLLLASRTCEVFILDEHRAIRYRGAIDDEYLQGGGSKRVGVRPHLVDALNGVLKGRSVALATTPVQGCPIERVEHRSPVGITRRTSPPRSQVITVGGAAAYQVPTQTLTYWDDVEPIIASRCRSCHRPGQVGPFSLLTNADTRRWASAIGEVIEDGRMPPWHADPRYGHFSNDRSLTARERSILIAWASQDPVDAGPNAEQSASTTPASEWSIGEPDLIFTMPAPFVVPAEGVIPYQHILVQTHFTHDVWVRAAEVRPGDRSVVHHLIIRTVEKGGSPYLVGYTSGDRALSYPAGTAKRISAGSSLMFEVHYAPNGRTRTDQSSVGLILARQPVEYEAITLGIANNKLIIPPGAANHPIRSRYHFKSKANLLSLSPHMHLRGKDFRYTAVYPDGSSEILLWVPAYDFSWQSTYVLDPPKIMPRLTNLECLAHFDNSSVNPHNPDPSRTVTYGPQSDSEMMVGFAEINVELDRPITVSPASIANLPGLRTVR